MKKNFLLLFFSLLLCFACEKENLLDKMEHIKHVGNSDPQLALEMLDSIKLTVRNEPEYVQRKYDLLDARLHDKAVIVATSDMMIKDLVIYFDENGSDAEIMEAHYYAGSVYRDLHDTPRALEHFLKALEIGTDMAKCDSMLLTNTYSNLSYLFYRVQDYQHALPMAQEEYRLLKEQNKANALVLIHVGASFTRLDSINAAKEAFRSALQLLKEKPIAGQQEVLSSLLYHFSRFGMSSEAQECDDIIKGYKDWTFDEPDYYLAKGEFYTLTRQMDSAIACYQKILQDSTNLVGMYDASKLLFLLHDEQGDVPQANRYAHLFVQVSDSLNLGERQELAATVNNEYQYHKNMEEERKAKEEKERYRNLLIGCSLLSAIVILALILLSVYRRNRQLKVLLAAQNELTRMKRDKQMLEEEVTQKEAELKDASESLEKTKEDLGLVNEELAHYNEELKRKEAMLTDKIEQNRTFMKLLHQAELETTAEELVRAIRMSSEGKRKMSSADWRQLYRAVDELHPTYRDVLVQKLGKLSESQMQVCYLMRIGLSNSQIENLTNFSHATIWRWVKKFSEKLGNEVTNK